MAIAGPVEPRAGTWKTWVLTSGSQFRLPPPPDQAATTGELQTLRALATQRDANALERIHYWDAGAPGYRWDQILADEFSKHGISGAPSTRMLSAVEVAIYDATIATWDSKYAYNRPRPTEADTTLASVLANPLSPSYPAEHAAVGTAAADVLAFFFPDDADVLAQQAVEAGQSRVLAGVQYPSDIAAGANLGHQVAALVIERAQHDGSEIPFTGSFPDAPDKWSLRGYPDGTAAVAPTFGTYKTWVLTSGNQLRPPAPPSPDSDQIANDLAELKDMPKTFATTAAAFFWQSQAGTTSVYFMQLGDQKLLENRLDANPPRAARVQALTSVAIYDGTVACWDAKFAYLMPRPFQLDPDIHPLFQTPAHPSYPSAEGCLAGSEAIVLGSLFPADADFLNARAQEAGMARLWAGVHTRTDIDAGVALGRAVARMVLDRAQSDGAQ
jgi:membrane-associated phospholipid phosphatase